MNYRDYDNRKSYDYGDDAADYDRRGPRENIRITIGGGRGHDPEHSSGEGETIPGLTGYRASTELHPSSRNVELWQPQPQVKDHSRETNEPEDVPDYLLYYTKHTTVNNVPQHNKNDYSYMHEIDLEIDGIKTEIISPTKPQPPSTKIRKKLGADTYFSDDYNDVDLSEFPPVYSMLLKEGCTVDVAEHFLGLVEDGLIGAVDWDSEHGMKLIHSVSRRSRHDEGDLKDFFDEFRRVEPERDDDTFLLFRQMFSRYCKGYKNYRKNVVPPLEPQDQKRIDSFYESDIAKGYTVLVKSGCRRFYKTEDKGDEYSDKHQLFVGRIPKDCYEDELVVKFSTLGTIKSFILMMDSQSNQTRGFGFLNYEDESLIDTAIRTFDQSCIRPGRRIGLSRGLSNNRLFFGGLPRHLTREDFLKEFSAVFPGVTDVILNKDYNDKSKNRGFVFVDFTSSHSAREAIQMAKTGKYKVGGTTVTNAEWARVLDKPAEQGELGQTNTQSKRVFIRGIASEITEEAIYFSLIWHGDVECIKKQGDYAFVTFKAHEGAQSVIDNPPQVICGAQVSVNWAAPLRKKYNDYPVPKNKACPTQWDPSNKQQATDQWAWSTGKEKKRKKEKSRKRQVSGHGNTSSLPSTLKQFKKQCNTSKEFADYANRYALEAYALKSFKARRETDFHKKIKETKSSHKFDVDLTETRRMKARTDILDFFEMDASTIPADSLSKQPGNTRAPQPGPSGYTRPRDLPADNDIKDSINIYKPPSEHPRRTR